MAPLGISLAPDDGTWVADPTWERIDTAYSVQSWSIDRGRQNEMSRTDTGTARVELIDRQGDFDPTNYSGHFFGRFIAGEPMGPLVQAAIALRNPVTDAWRTLFRGFISSLQWVPYRSEDHANVTLELVDGLALLAAIEMPLDGTFGDDAIDGNIVYNANPSLDAVQTRINQILTEAGWPLSLRFVSTGNVGLQELFVAPRTTVLSVIQDAADADFPDVANVYVGGPRFPGQLVFRGRYARFHPDVAEYQIAQWQLGDDQIADADPAHVVRISPPLTASLDDTLLYSSAYATPQDRQGDLDALLGGQYVTDATAKARYGLRTWSAESLLTRNGEVLATSAPTSGLQETKLFADYVRDNYKSARVRVGQLTVKPRRPDGPYGAATWQLLCGVDLSDLVHLTTVHGGGGGFDHDFFVEGIHYQARPGGSLDVGGVKKTTPYVELTLDVSPRGYYDQNPFEA